MQGRPPCPQLRWAAPPASLTSFLEPRWPPQTLTLPARMLPLLAPDSHTPLAGARTGRGAARGSQPPPPRPAGAAGEGPPAARSPAGGPRAAPGPGAREGAAGAGPGYLQEESFGFGSPLLGPVQLALPLPAAEKRGRLRGAPSRAPRRAPARLPAPPRGAPAAPRPRRPAAPPAPQTHFCSKAAMSLASRMFSSGSQVLYLPSHRRKTRVRTGEAAARAREQT